MATLFGPPCSTAEDCRGSSEAESAGRCGPEVASVEGRCHAECPGSCEITKTRFPQEVCPSGAISNPPIEP